MWCQAAYMGGLVAAAFSHPFSSGQTKSKPWETRVGSLATQALGDRTARASGPSAEACGIRTQEPVRSKDHPWYEHCKQPSSSILPSCSIASKISNLSHRSREKKIPTFCNKEHEIDEKESEKESTERGARRWGQRSSKASQSPERGSFQRTRSRFRSWKGVGRLGSRSSTRETAYQWSLHEKDFSGEEEDEEEVSTASRASASDVGVGAAGEEGTAMRRGGSRPRRRRPRRRGL